MDGKDGKGGRDGKCDKNSMDGKGCRSGSDISYLVTSTTAMTTSYKLTQIFLNYSLHVRAF